MTDREFKRLSRAELIEIIYELQKSEAQLRAENEKLQKKLADKSIHLLKSGSIAEAALSLNGVFEAAQAAADQYLAQIQENCSQTEMVRAQAIAEVEKKTEQMLADARQQSEKMLADAREEILHLREQMQEQTGQVCDACAPSGSSAERNTAPER